MTLLPAWSTFRPLARQHPLMLLVILLEAASCTFTRWVTQAFLPVVALNRLQFLYLCRLKPYLALADCPHAADVSTCFSDSACFTL